MSTAIAALLLTASCGTQAGQTGSGGDASKLPAEVQKELQNAYSGSAVKSPPAEGPAPQKGKNVWILSCGESISNCATTTATAKADAAKMGWSTTVYDTNYDPSKMAEGISKAIAAGADGVFTYSIDCPLMKQPLALAKKAGVQVVGAEALECDPPGFGANVSYAEGSSLEFYKAIGRAQAISVLANVGLKANILIPFETDALNQKPLVDSFKATINEYCGSCKMTTIEWTIPDMGAQLEQKVQQALVKDPGINAMQFGYTGILNNGPMAAIRAAGRTNNLYLAVSDPEAGVVKQLADGVFKGSGIGFSIQWEAHAAMDNLNRLFNGQKPSNSGIGIQVYDAEHNIKDGKWVPPVDFESDYDDLFRGAK